MKTIITIQFMPNFASLHVGAMERNNTERLFLELAKIYKADMALGLWPKPYFAWQEAGN